MAFSSTPQFSTYKTENIKFDGTPVFRSGDLSDPIDLQIVNFYYDRVSQTNKQTETYLKKRPGLAASVYSLNKADANDPVRGCHYDSESNAFYWAQSNMVCRLHLDGDGVPDTIAFFSTVAGNVGFCSYLKSDNDRYVAFTDGQELWLHNITDDSVAEVTDPDLPVPHQPYPVYLDGYIFLAKSGTGDIYNCEVDNPTSWEAGDFMTAEMSSDYIVAMSATKNHIIAFGSNSLEYFYDAGTASGSPLQRNDSAYKSVGYITGLVNIGDTIFFVGQEQNQGIGVYVINNFQVKRVSNEVVDRTLQVYAFGTANQKAPLELTNAGFMCSIDGHNFYILRTTQTTWAFDYEEGVWYQWESASGLGLQIEACWPTYNGGVYMAIAGQTHISNFAPVYGQDFGNNFSCRYVTEKLDFGTQNQKTMSKLSVRADRVQISDEDPDTYLLVSWSDDDYANWSSERSISLSLERLTTYALGRFRNRAFMIEYADEHHLRLWGLEVDINVGSH